MNRLINSLMQSVHRACDIEDYHTSEAVLAIIETRLLHLPYGERGRVARMITGARERINEVQAVEWEA